MGKLSDTHEAYFGDGEDYMEKNMSRYDNYISRMCRTGNYTTDQARELAISKEVEQHYQSEYGNVEENSIYMPTGECK